MKAGTGPADARGALPGRWRRACLAAVALLLGLTAHGAAALTRPQIDAVRAGIEREAQAAAELRRDAKGWLVALSRDARHATAVDAALVVPVRDTMVTAARIARDGERLGGRLSDAAAATAVDPAGLARGALDLEAAAARHGRAAAAVHTAIATGSAPTVAAAAEAYGPAAARFVTAMDALEIALSGRLRGRLPGSDIEQSAHRFVDQRGVEDLLDEQDGQPGFGLYTHVLLARPDERGRALIDAVRTIRWDPARMAPDDIARTNLFAIPVADEIDAVFASQEGAEAGNALIEASVYDYARAEDLLFRFCRAADDPAPPFCAGRLRGPYLLSHADLLLDAEAVTPPYLLVDLSDVHPGAFGEMVQAVMAQVMLEDFTSREKIDTLHLQFLTIVLTAADWVDPIRKSIAEIITMGDGGG
jgi:hypothetical protein